MDYTMTVEVNTTDHDPQSDSFDESLTIVKIIGPVANLEVEDEHFYAMEQVRDVISEWLDLVTINEFHGVAVRLTFKVEKI